jgi:signal transduction histidine kinase
MGGTMHKLNYFHQKYITQLVKSVKTFQTHSVSANEIRDHILLVKQQPIQCIDLIGPLELFMMELIGTRNTLKICQDDLLIANALLQKVQQFENKELDKEMLINSLFQGISNFENSGDEFEPLVNKTVETLFFIVMGILITKAFIVPIIGLILSNGVARDYQLLLKTKTDLEKEKKRSALIQSERISSLTIMVSGMAHEVNTPIGVSITANSYLGEILSELRQSYENKELTKAKFDRFIIEMEKSNFIISNNLSSTAELVETFKEVSVDQTVDELRKVNLKSYIEQTLLNLTPIIKSSNITLKLSGDDDLQLYMYCVIFKQVITNLVTNAINHAFQNQETGTLSISVKLTVSNEIHFIFEDDGCGISQMDQTHIFDPFFTTKKGNGGTGLGLHILYNLVTDKLMGRVTCTSEINSGTRFDIYFPRNIKDYQR